MHEASYLADLEYTAHFYPFLAPAPAAAAFYNISALFPCRASPDVCCCRPAPMTPQ